MLEKGRKPKKETARKEKKGGEVRAKSSVNDAGKRNHRGKKKEVAASEKENGPIRENRGREDQKGKEMEQRIRKPTREEGL